MRPISIRRVDEKDFAAIQAIKLSRTKKSFEENLLQQEKGDVEFLAVEVNGELVCYVILKWHGKPSHPEYPDLEDLYTKESARGKGYAELDLSR